MSSGLIRWCGLAAMLGGVLWALWGVAQQLAGWGQPGTTAYERYELVNRLLPFALLLVVVGFIGLHAAQRRSYGKPGTAGFATVLIGLMLITAGNVGEFWVFSDQTYEGAGRNASWALFLLGHLVLVIGTLLFGIATVRAKEFPRDAAILFAAMGMGVVVPFLGAVIFAIPFVWLGYLLYSGKYQIAQQPSRVR